MRVSFGFKFMKVVFAVFLFQIASWAWGQGPSSLGTPPRAEPPVSADCIYVDPVNGSNSNSGTKPVDAFRNISRAIIESTLKPRLSKIILLPGTYSTSSNFESFPLSVPDGISIQGTSALNTILDGEGSDVFILAPSQAGQDFRYSYFDGFSIQNAAVAIQFASEPIGFKPTFSNIVLSENQVGLLMRAVDLEGDNVPDDSDQNNFVEHRPRLINLTFVENGIAIRDMIVVLSSPPADYGEADPAIANCLFVGNALDLDGVDLFDLINDDGVRSNVFCHINSGRIKPGRLSPAGGSLPFECDSTTVDEVFINPASGDYRLMPTIGGPSLAYLVDQGIGKSSTLAYHRLTFPTLIEPEGRRGEKIWDTDMEGFCNERMVGKGNDIGADELGELIIAGYQKGTTTFAAGDIAVIWLNPVAALPGQSFGAFRIYNERPNLGFLRWLPKNTPGARPSGTKLPEPTSNSTGLDCISDTGKMGELLTVPFTLGQFQLIPVTSVTSPARVNNQFVSGLPGQPRFTTNLQSYTIE